MFLSFIVRGIIFTLRTSLGRTRSSLGVLGGVLFLASAFPLAAQVDSRVEEIQQARRQKAKVVVPEETSKAESRLNYIVDEKILERITEGVGGFRIKIGGMATGQGFALGPEYFREDLADGNLNFRGSIQGAVFEGIPFRPPVDPAQAGP